MENNFIIWSPGVTIEAIEQQIIVKAFKHFRGNKSATASSLGITVRTLENKFEKYEKEQIAEEERKKDDEIKRADLLRRARGEAPNQQYPAPQTYRRPEDGTQPALVATEKLAVSVPQRGEVQEVLPRQAASVGNRRSR